MARRGTAVGDVTNILQSENITGREKIPAMMQGDTEPQVVTTQELKEYVTEGIEVDREFTLEEIESLLNF